MGVFDFLFGSSTNPQTGATTSQQYSSAPPWFQQGLEYLMTTGMDVSQQPYTPYPGQRVAEFNPQEQQAFQTVSNQVGAYQPNFADANAYMRNASAPITDVSAYMDPYTQEVIDATMEEMNRQGAMGLNTLRATGANSGGLNSSREGVAEAEYMRALDANKALAASNLYSQGFTQANQLAREDATRKMQGAQGLTAIAGAGQTYGLQDAAALQQSGAAQRGLEQTNVDVAYQDFLNQRDWQMNQLLNYGSLVQGVPIGTMTNTTTQTNSTMPGPSVVGQIAGLGTAGLGAYALGDMFFARGGLVDDGETKGGRRARGVELDELERSLLDEIMSGGLAGLV